MPIPHGVVFGKRNLYGARTSPEEEEEGEEPLGAGEFGSGHRKSEGRRSKRRREVLQQLAIQPGQFHDSFRAD